MWLKKETLGAKKQNNSKRKFIRARATVPNTEKVDDYAKLVVRDEEGR